tara:strand:- start:342 stop:1166 length:825 start_codon:yes stop_codon:yes gene_type:complete
MVEDKKFNMRMMQIHSVDHCNYSCKGCSHSSDIAPKKFFTYDEYMPHLEKLSEYVTAERIDITGGEPFLNKKNLLGLIKGVRSSGITETVEVATNAFWLRNWERYSEILENIDQFYITYHPEQKIPPKEIRERTDMLQEKFKLNFIYIYVPKWFNEVEFFDEPKQRDHCKFCPQLMANGTVAKCNIIGYTKFNGFNTTKKFEELKHQGVYNIYSGNAKTFAEWHDNLFEVCNYCGFYDEQDKIKPELRIPHNVHLTEEEVNILKKEKPRKGILG